MRLPETAMTMTAPAAEVAVLHLFAAGRISKDAKETLKSSDQLAEAGSLRLIIAGGGTGGHLFPGVAIAQAFLARDPRNEAVFICTGRPLEKTILKQAGFELLPIRVEGIKGRGMLRQIKAAAGVPLAVWQSMKLLWRIKPHLVVGVGGYSAGPVVVAAWLLGIKTALHEQNLLPGITNRILSRFVNRIFLSFEDLEGRFNPGKVVVSGNPIRAEFLLSQHPKPSQTLEGFSLLVAGGSQGARGINQAMIQALPHLGDPSRYTVIHQTGEADEQEVKAAYARAGVNAKVGAFFTDMPQRYRQADLIVCRAGATTVAEVTAMGKPVIFVPFPHAADNHQVLNAKRLVEKGAAEMIEERDLTGECLAERIRHFSVSRQELKQMADLAATLGRPDAAHHIVEECYRLLGRGEKEAAHVP